jgi:uncharacterized membrane protein YtjA (UPF0391 family)
MLMQRDADVRDIDRQGGIMLYWAVVFFLVALVAAVFGFTGIAVAAAGFAKILFFIFLVFFVISLGSHLAHRGA